MTQIKKKGVANYFQTHIINSTIAVTHTSSMERNSAAIPVGIELELLESRMPVVTAVAAGGLAHLEGDVRVGDILCAANGADTLEGMVDVLDSAVGVITEDTPTIPFPHWVTIRCLFFVKDNNLGY